ncbi:hypothetical protein [Kribbella caucasensis]|nr:hypothetical protein [Kribbella sp. VKM Ac-2527]
MTEATDLVAESEDGPQKRDRAEVFVEFTRSICPVCKVVVDAQVNIRDDKVYLRKRCREHAVASPSPAGWPLDSTYAKGSRCSTLPPGAAPRR